MMRVAVFGFDGLEYTWVDSHDLLHLKQVEYGRVSIEEIEYKSTPALWGSFITGAQPSEHGVEGFAKWQNPALELLRNAGLRLLGEKRYIGRKVLGLFRFQKRPYTKSDFKHKTIFDCTPRHHAVSIPSYNEEEPNRVHRQKILQALNNPALTAELEGSIRNAFQEKKERVLALMNEDWDLLMVHFYITDILNHLKGFDMGYMIDLYREMDRAMAEFLAKIDDPETLVIIASDHGSERGTHTDYGFYSLSRPLNLDYPRITDFASIIVNAVTGKTAAYKKDEEGKIKEELERLGYF